MSTTDIKRVITSKTMVNFRHFEVEAPHGTSLMLVTDCRADGNSFIGPAGRIKTLKTQLYQACRLLLRQSRILYLHDKNNLTQSFI